MSQAGLLAATLTATGLQPCPGPRSSRGARQVPTCVRRKDVVGRDQEAPRCFGCPRGNAVQWASGPQAPGGTATALPGPPLTHQTRVVGSCRPLSHGGRGE